MSSTLKKERIVYYTGITLFVLVAISLCFPYITWGVYTNNQSVTLAESVTYLGWQLFGLSAFYKKEPIIMTETGGISDSGIITPRSVTPLGTESMFVIFNYILFFAALAIAVIDGFALYENYKNGKSLSKKFINVFHIGFVIIAVSLIIVYIPYVKYLNSHVFTSSSVDTVAAEAKAWSSFAFKSLTGIETKMAAGPFLIAVFGFAAAMVSIIVTMKLQDNSILYPYKRRHVFAAVVCLVLCVSVFFLPNIDYYFSTYYIHEKSDTLMSLLFQGKPTGIADAKLNSNALERIAAYFTSGVGWDCLTQGSGDIEGYYKVMFSLMFVISGLGIMFSAATLLAAAGVIKFNFDKKYLNMISLVLMVMGILLWAASFVYSIGVNVRLNTTYARKDFYQYFLKAYPDGQFPQTTCTVGAWLSMIPGILGFTGTKLLCAYDD